MSLEEIFEIELEIELKIESNTENVLSDISDSEKESQESQQSNIKENQEDFEKRKSLKRKCYDCDFNKKELELELLNEKNKVKELELLLSTIKENLILLRESKIGIIKTY